MNKYEAIDQAELYLKAINVLHRARATDANEALIEAMRVEIEKTIGRTFLDALTAMGVFDKPEPQITVSP